MRFEVKAVKANNAVAALTLDAASDADAVSQARQLGYAVLTVRPQRAFAPAWRRSGFQLLLFTQELLALFDAGLTLVEAMETLGEKEQRPEGKKILDRIIRTLYEGQPLSAALEHFPAVFPPLYVATVRASEKTGDLGRALARYVAYQSQLDAARKKVVSASIYPALLIGVGTLVVLFLMGYVVPRFASVYEGLGSAMPWFSTLLLAWGRLIAANAGAVAATAAISVAGAAYGFSHPTVKRRLATQLWRMPAVGERMRVYQLARFYRTVGMLLAGGTPVVTALDMVIGMLPPALRAQLQGAARDIGEGRSISLAMDRNGLTTPVALRMLRVGEGTGQMGAMMERIARFYEDEMAQWVDWFTRLFEPVLMTAIGVMIGTIVVLMYLPIFELAGSIK